MPVAVERLKRRADFLFVAGGRHKHVAPGFVLQARPRPDAPPDSVRIGFTATKKIGTAVIRNRARRRLREAARATLPAMALPGCDYVLIARAGSLTRPYTALLDDLRAALTTLRPKAAP